MNKENSKDKKLYSVDEIVKVMNEIKILISPWTMYGKGGAWDRKLTGKTLEESKRDASVDLHYYRKYGRR